MNAAAFLVAVRRRARAVSPVRDPLAAAHRFLDASGETGENQALRKVVETLANGAGDFDESEVRLFNCCARLPLAPDRKNGTNQGR